nr:mucin-15 isoform X1 [Misgurnus anguillicaudatus]
MQRCGLQVQIQVGEPDMKLPLGITLALTLLIFQNLQQVSTQIPEDWLRISNTSSEEQPTAAEQSGENELSNVVTYAIPLNSEENDGESYGSMVYNEQNPAVTEPMPPATEIMPGSVTEDGSSPTPPLMMAYNSSSEVLEAEHNETETQETPSQTTPSVPDQTNQIDLNDTHPDPKPDNETETPSQTTPSVPDQTNQIDLNNTNPDLMPDNSTEDSSHEETGSGYVPTEVSPTTTTKDPADQEDAQNTTTVIPPETPTEAMTPPAVPEDWTTAAPDTENADANLTGPFDTRGESPKEFSGVENEDNVENKNGKAWAVILVIGIIVGLIALTAFIILNRRNNRDFSHRKLEEEMSPDPVLRLDNSEPLDFGYYNPGLQMDNIQMTNFPHGRLN